MRTTRSFLCFSFVVVVGVAPALACSSGAASPVSNLADAAPPPAACVDGTHGTPGHCETVLAMAKSDRAIDPIRDHHGTVIVETDAGPYLYVLGGTDAWKTTHKDVQRAKIHADDGSLDPFEKVSELPKAMAGHTTAALGPQGRTIVITGGVSGGKTSRTTYSTTLDASGALGAWTQGPDLPLPVMHHTCSAARGWLYCFGGRGLDSKSTTMAARAKIDDATGTIAAFEALPALAHDRSHHMACVRKDVIYLVGGLSGDPAGVNAPLQDVVHASVAADGSLGDFDSAGTLPAPLSVTNAQLFNDELYAFGGFEDVKGALPYTSSILRGRFAEDGSLTFETLPAKLATARAHVHQAPMYKRWIYVVGGHTNEDTSLGDVEIGTFQ
jgi:hypothetical protein